MKVRYQTTVEFGEEYRQGMPFPMSTVIIKTSDEESHAVILEELRKLANTSAKIK